MPLPVSHAFHTSIVAPMTQPLRTLLKRLHFELPRFPVVGNLDGDFYPMGPGSVPEILDILARQMGSPVRFVRGLRRLYDAGARVFVEVGPKKALQGFAYDVLGGDADVLSLFTNHPKIRRHRGVQSGTVWFVRSWSRHGPSSGGGSVT